LGVKVATANLTEDGMQAPVVGRWSDAYGRKPFLVLSFACGGAQVVALLLYITWGTSLFWYFPASVRLPILIHVASFLIYICFQVDCYALASIHC
jgi:MFS family permease